MNFYFHKNINQIPENTLHLSCAFSGTFDLRYTYFLGFQQGGINWNRENENNPLSVIFNSGMTDNVKKESVKKDQRF